mmetsp:Transcript_139430/g.445979  ORF Transcript_139430/g.445979 Transcript_139430/m.445979 type:complete len:233 (+) Transcript_139430:506-1204(+)
MAAAMSRSRSRQEGPSSATDSWRQDWPSLESLDSLRLDGPSSKSFDDEPDILSRHEGASFLELKNRGAPPLGVAVVEAPPGRVAGVLSSRRLPARLRLGWLGFSSSPRKRQLSSRPTRGASSRMPKDPFFSKPRLDDGVGATPGVLSERPRPRTDQGSSFFAEGVGALSRRRPRADHSAFSFSVAFMLEDSIKLGLPRSHGGVTARSFRLTTVPASASSLRRFSLSCELSFR